VNTVRALLCAVDGDDSLREALRDLLENSSRCRRLYAAEEFLASGTSRAASRSSGSPEVQQDLNRNGVGSGSCSSADFGRCPLSAPFCGRRQSLPVEPFSDSTLFDAVQAALAHGSLGRSASGACSMRGTGQKKSRPTFAHARR
jgi:hypothetical protein